MKSFLSLLFPLFLLFSACTKKELEYNKPATYWYENILKEINFGNLESADSHFSSLQSEHINSPLLPESMLILAQAHMDKEEYLLATFYVDEYAKRYSSFDDQDYLGYLKILANYYGFKNYAKDQEFIARSIDEIVEYLDTFPKSRYTPFVEYIYIKFKLGENELNESIANVYRRKGKIEASKDYLSRNQEVLEGIKIKPSYIPWYVRMFNW
ncbi:outer membrane protein assembly factor BamD [Helicobacter himalayensis]|uniref:outer membrane protein assembly factor BamD n=1 Tax=Helicobacter himalayensis TaxID=1591088 RepID=UPI00082E2928|nr:outer membrane protein assembly factor BamD [Helicobacter himalayensis]